MVFDFQVMNSAQIFSALDLLIDNVLALFNRFKISVKFSVFYIISWIWEKNSFAILALVSNFEANAHEKAVYFFKWDLFSGTFFNTALAATPQFPLCRRMLGFFSCQLSRCPPLTPLVSKDDLPVELSYASVVSRFCNQQSSRLFKHALVPSRFPLYRTQFLKLTVKWGVILTSHAIQNFN